MNANYVDWMFWVYYLAGVFILLVIGVCFFLCVLPTPTKRHNYLKRIGFFNDND